MRIAFHKNFEKEYRKLRESEKRRVKAHLALFIKDPFVPLLNNHPLKGTYTGYRSINVGGDLRAIYKSVGRDTAVFTVIGRHGKLYSS